MTRPFAVLGGLAAVLLCFAGCGGDDEEPARTATGTETTATTETARMETERPPASAPVATSTDEGGVPGGPGDEEPARSPALFTGRNGRITPRLVQVPPYIAVSVELHSADGEAYGLLFGDQSVDTSERETATVLLAGVRPGTRIVGRPFGGRGNRVVIEASAEPGP